MIQSLKNEIIGILSSNLSSYEIHRQTGVTRQLIDKYRKDISAIEGMTIKTAEKLLKLKEITNHDRTSKD